MISNQVRSDPRLAGLVKRYATWPTLTQQSVGEHSWQVLRIYMEIFGPPPPEITWYITHHDTPELKVGDPPFPLKKNNPSLKKIYDKLEEGAIFEITGQFMPEISEGQRTMVKICDLLEMWEFGIHEWMMGNRYAEPVIADTEECVLELASHHSSPLITQVREHMRKRRKMYE
jgi:5'-deoxynucleotidase YfbR-like HD superfamily hydrolase